MVTLRGKPVENWVVRQAQIMPENINQDVGFGHVADIVVRWSLSSKSLAEGSTFTARFASVDEGIEIPKSFGFPSEQGNERIKTTVYGERNQANASKD